MLEFAEYIKIFVGLVAIVNPLGVIPLFAIMTAGSTESERYQIARLVSVSVTAILLGALLFGEPLLTFFGITIDSFRVGGGILILLMAIAMLHARTSGVRQTAEEANESIEKESVAIVPLAMPLLAGPGAISTVILAAHKAGGVGHYLLIGVSILLLSVLIWGVLRISPWVAERAGTTGINISTRIMGLILASIAVEFIANGIRGLFPVLGSV